MGAGRSIDQLFRTETSRASPETWGDTASLDRPEKLEKRDLPACADTRDPGDKKEHRAKLVLKEKKESKAKLDHPDVLDHEEPVCPASMAQPEPRGPKVCLEKSDKPDPKASLVIGFRKKLFWALEDRLDRKVAAATRE